MTQTFTDFFYLKNPSVKVRFLSVSVCVKLKQSSHYPIKLLFIHTILSRFEFVCYRFDFFLNDRH